MGKYANKQSKSLDQYLWERSYCLKVAPRAFCAYHPPRGRKFDPDQLQMARNVIEEDGYNGRMSAATMRQVRGIISRWVQARKAWRGKHLHQDSAVAPEFVFVTLTLPAKQAHTDQHLKRYALDRWIADLKRELGTAKLHYLWRAETQQNGNIHWHVLLDRAVNWQTIRRLWVRIMANLGYVGQYRANQEAFHAGGFKARPEAYEWWSHDAQLKAWRKGVATDWADPNCTDIHALQKIENVAAYVCKYVTKDTDARKIEGRLWGCSDELRALADLVLELDVEELPLLDEVEELRKIDVSEGVMFWAGNVNQVLKTRFPEIRAKYVSWWTQQAQQLWNPQPKPPPPPPPEPDEPSKETWPVVLSLFF